MDVNIKQMVEIFNPEIRFLVPLYQRRYVWERNKQWIPLWEDLIAVAEHYLEDPEDVTPHFLGAIVILQQMTVTGDPDMRQVIDGQQRLTTLQLLIDAVKEVVEEIASECDLQREKVNLEKLVLNDKRLYSGDKLFKVWPTNADQMVFRTVMTNQSMLSDTDRKANIAKAHMCFKECAREWITEGGASDRERRVAALVLAISKGLTVAVIDLGNADDSQAIFETLNARGEPLLASDLAKNHLLRLAADEGADLDSLYENYWRRFDTEPWNGARIDALLFHWTVMEAAPEEISGRRLFTEFRGTIRDRTAVDVLKQLHEAANEYERLLDRDCGNDARVRVFLDRWRTVNLGVLTPLLLWLFQNRQAMGPADFRDALCDIESWFMRRIIVRHRASGYQRFVTQLLGAIKSSSVDPTSISDVLRETLVQATSIDWYWPRSDRINEVITEWSIYGQISRGRLRVVLEALEDRIRSGDGKAEESCPRGLTIEHVLPVGWTESAWPLHESYHREQRENILQRLGNLTLVTSPLNSAMSNDPWTEKRATLDCHSVLHLNRRLVKSHRWDEDTIIERGEQFAAEICEIWPHPED